MSRNPNRTSSVYQGADGYWHGRVTVGVKDDGRSDRRHVMSKSKATVVRKVRDLEKLRDSGRVPRIGEKWTFGKWLGHWLETIARPGLRESSYNAYRIAVYKHLIPTLGNHRLDRLEPEHLERLYRRMIDNGARPATAHQVHRTARSAIGEANRRGHVVRNVAALARPPRVQSEPVEPYTIDEVQRILAAASERRNSARWAIALALGIRQGEALALRWQDVDLDTSTLRIRATRLRPVYEHGCGGTCGKKPGFCPQRKQRNAELGETKSAAGKRVIGLPDELVAMLKLHQEEQDRERRTAGQLWRDGDWVFASPTGTPLNPNSDYHEWKALLRTAEVREGRLHDARHTAATVLLVLGVPERTVMSVMGWSSTAMAARYQHVTDPIRRDVARQVGSLLWATDDDPSSTN
ncbi:tyrosine-type recombinase/integrase [Nocardioides terrisoli]|uniref:tyrosine-type recombinase/integrase n=1 Tax=Nocardioides terrisoli TaxID=3388267 RepID=UPI00287B7D10|nr:site-specific integrase [Nocardioides marmorisolisilvae]